MALVFVLDGYNIIKSDDTGRLTLGSLEEQRERFLELVRTRHPQGSARNAVTVVFDSSEARPVYDSGISRMPGMDVLFSGGKTADDVIEEIVLGSGDPANTVVVTDDKGLRRRLGGSGARFMQVRDFLRRLFSGRSPGERGADGVDQEAAHKIDEELRGRWFK